MNRCRPANSQRMPWIGQAKSRQRWHVDLAIRCRIAKPTWPPYGPVAGSDFNEKPLIFHCVHLAALTRRFTNQTIPESMHTKVVGFNSSNGNGARHALRVVTAPGSPVGNRRIPAEPQVVWASFRWRRRADAAGIAKRRAARGFGQNFGERGVPEGSLHRGQRVVHSAVKRTEICTV